MREQSVDFADFNRGPEDLERVYERRLSYKVAFAEYQKQVAPMSSIPSGARYAKVIIYLGQNDLLHRFDDVVAHLRSIYNTEMHRVGLSSSPFGKDDSWIHWDLAKQAYFFLSRDRSMTSRHYRIADPLRDERLQDAIVSRHIGWELWNARDREPWTSKPEVRHLLGPECESSVLKGQPASWALAKLGALIRS